MNVQQPAMARRPVRPIAVGEVPRMRISLSDRSAIGRMGEFPAWSAQLRDGGGGAVMVIVKLTECKEQKYEILGIKTNLLEHIK